jgi:hypothetical protein
MTSIETIIAGGVATSPHSRPASGAPREPRQDLSGVAIDVYARTAGVDRITAAVAATPVHLDDADPDDLQRRTMSREAAAAVLRHRLAGAAGGRSGEIRNFHPPPLNLSAGGPGARRTHRNDGFVEPGAEDGGDAARQEHMRELRAHVQMLQLQVKATHSTAQSRSVKVARVMDVARKRHRDRVSALVNTGNDDAEEQYANAASPYGEDLAEEYEQKVMSQHGSKQQHAADRSAVSLNTVEHPDESFGSWPSRRRSDDDNEHERSRTDEHNDSAALAAHDAFANRRNPNQHATITSGDSSEQEHARRRQRTPPGARRASAAIERADRSVTTQRERIEELKRRLTAAGVDVEAVLRKTSRSPAPHPRALSAASDVVVSERLYPGHAKVAPQPRPGNATPAPNARDRSESPVKAREMDPAVLNRLYRPVREYQPPPPVQHNIKARTELIRNGEEPYRGAMLPPSKVPKAVFTNEAVTRMVDQELKRRAAHLKASSDSVAKERVAEVTAVRRTLGLAPLVPKGSPNAPENVDRNGLPYFTPDKAVQLHNVACDRRRRIHESLAAKVLAKEKEGRIHTPRTLSPEELKASAVRLHDESMASVRATMRAAAEKANAVSRRTAQAFAPESKPEADLKSTFERLAAGK